MIPCAICGKRFVKLSGNHLKLHGYTLERYSRVFNPHTGSSLSPTTGVPDPEHPHRQGVQTISVPATFRDSVISDLLATPSFRAAATYDVAQAIFSTSARGALALSIQAMVATRINMHARAVADMEKVRQELLAPWRLEAGGKDGAPTPTSDLVSLASMLHQEVVKSEELVHKTLRMAMDEQATTQGDNMIHGRPAFKGDAERIPVPPNLNPQDRDAVRTLLRSLGESLQRRAEVTAPLPVVASPSREVTPHDSRGVPAPAANTIPAPPEPF